MVKGASAAQEIREPADLQLKPELEGQFPDLFERLTKAGKDRFVREMIEALFAAQKRNSLRPVRDVINAWYRTLIVFDDPNYGDNVKSARRSRPTQGESVKELRERIKGGT